MKLLKPGTLLQGRYEIVRLIGKGGMGAVYEAIDNRLKNRVALKQTLVSEDRLFKAFEREAQILASLRHPALTHVSDHFTDPIGQFLVMEFIPGEDLATLLAKHQKPFPLNTVLVWADHLLNALDYLHTQPSPIIHRDIKPQNLKLTPRNEIILLDFGLAKGLSTSTSQQQTAGSIFGYTPKYAPLEQIQGTGTDPRSDLYSLSATLYHLLTNVSPDDALQRAASILNRQPDTLRPVFVVNPEIPRPISDVVMRGMALGAQDRFASADEMRRALRIAARLQPPADASTMVVSPFPTSHSQHPESQHPRPGVQPPPPASVPNRPHRFTYDQPSPPVPPAAPTPPGQPGPAYYPPPPQPSQPYPPPPHSDPSRPPSTPRGPRAPEKKGDWGKYCGLSALGCLAFIVIGVVAVVALAMLGQDSDESQRTYSSSGTPTPGIASIGQGIVGTVVMRPTATAIPPLQPLVPAGWSLVLHDTFDSNANGWGVEAYDDEFAMGKEDLLDGRYRSAATARKDFARRMPLNSIGEISDFVLQATVRRVTGPLETAEYGLIFRQSGSDYYRFSITDDQYYRVSLRYEGSWSSLIEWEEADAIKPGEDNQLAVVARGSNFEFYINGKQIRNVTDTTIPKGKVGFLIGLEEGNVGVFEFDDVMVYTP